MPRVSVSFDPCPFLVHLIMASTEVYLLTQVSASGLLLEDIALQNSKPSKLAWVEFT
jgi:hypothetical protein